MSASTTSQPSSSEPVPKRSSKSFWALLSGILGAAASCFAKLAFGNHHIDVGWLWKPSSSFSCPSSVQVAEWRTICFGSSSTTTTTNAIWQCTTCLLPRAVFLVAMVLCNASMVACFVGGLQDAGSIAGTALATAANFMTSAAAGYWLWKEGGVNLSGLMLVIMGTVLLVWAQRPDKGEVKDETKTINKRTNAKSHKHDANPNISIMTG